MGPLTRVVQTGIGLAAELKAASKERKASEVNVDDGTPSEHGLWSYVVMSFAHHFKSVSPGSDSDWTTLQPRWWRYK